MQSATSMFGVPFKQNPRIGQAAVFERYGSEAPRQLNVKLPTGYGKTITALGSYAILRAKGKVNRLLMIVPTTAQIAQFKADGPGDLKSVGFVEAREVVDVSFFGVNAIKKSTKNEAQVFAITIQSLCQPIGRAIVSELMSKGNWMVVVDEYHHYGDAASWGAAVKTLHYDNLLAMSATPSRKNDDSAFGDPDIFVHYRDAAREHAVKPLKSHSYNYRVDAVLESGEVTSFTTDELVEAVGSSAPDEIEKFKATRKMRWSPKYVSPLVSIPIERMLRERIATGHKLQAIVGAMCVSHAEMVAKQIADMFPELVVDWVGTGPDGRPDKDNEAIIKKFCPPKDANGTRVPSLDVLVHVGKAGEGLDSVLVSEVIHLNKASKNNSNDQENGRAARYIHGVVGHINFDSGSEYALMGYIGDKIMDAMDDELPSSSGDDEDGGLTSNGDDDYSELPEEPSIQLWDVRLESIDSGDRLRMKEVAKEAGITGIDYASLNENMDNPEWLKIDSLWKGMRHREAQKFNSEAVIRQWRESVSDATSVVAGLVIRTITKSGVRLEKNFVGDIKKRINRMKKIRCGEISEDIEVCKRHYQWLKELESEIITSGSAPQWLQ